jgi:hypothetical protein
MKRANLQAKLSEVDYADHDVAARKLNRMIIGNPTLAEPIVRYYRAETGEAMQIFRKTNKGVPKTAKETLNRLSHDGLCVLP